LGLEVEVEPMMNPATTVVKGATPPLQLVSEQGAQGEVGRVYAEIRETLGISFVPNFFKTLATLRRHCALLGRRTATTRGAAPFPQC
jgi:hypothetical protein